VAKFRFRLEALLRVRRQAEQVRQRAVAELEGRRRDLETALRRHQDQIAAGKRTQCDRLVGRLDVTELRARAGSTIQHMREAQRILLELAGVHRRLEEARADLIEATRRRRAVELLRERRFAAWKKRIDGAENAALDELAVFAAARKDRDR
jgi:flagellar FliJ protein